MIDGDNNKRKGSITEEDIATLLSKYEASEVLTLLQEVARYPGRTIDWDALVEKTATRITNAREYQMLWRHLAYRDSLLDVQDGAQPLDDDSDLDCELEAFPRVNRDESMEVAALVKVMIDSGSRSESDIPVKKEEKNGSMASRKKKRKWSSEEDQQLIAAVEKWGESNWASIVKGDFNGDRTTSQLSQRWGLLKKKRDISSVGTSQSGLKRTEVQTANQALSIAVGNRPPTRNITAGISLNSSSAKAAEAPVSISSSSLQLQNQSKAGPIQTSSLTNTNAKSHVVTKKSSLNPNSKPDLVVAANTAATAACIGGLSGAPSSRIAEPGKCAASVATRALPAGASAKPSVAGSAGAVSKTVQHVPSTPSPSLKTSHQMVASSTSGLPQKAKETITEANKRSVSGNPPKEQAQDKTASTNPEMGVDKQVSSFSHSSVSMDVDVKTEATGVCQEVSKKSQNAVGSGNQSEAKEKVNVHGNQTFVKAKNLEASEKAGVGNVMLLQKNGV